MTTFFTLPTVTENERFMGVAGDWHGNWRWAITKMAQFRQLGIHSIFQLGDFGVWPGLDGADYIYMLNETAEQLDQTIYVTLGNHEDYSQVYDLEPDDLGIRWIAPRIALLPRVAHFEIQGVKFLSLGGAPSIDFEYRRQFIDWWPEEMLTDGEAEQAIAGGHVDVMLAHDAPDNGTQAVQRILDNNPQGWSPKALAYAKEGRDRMTRVVQSVQPDLCMHGHYHVQGDGWLNYGTDQYPGRIVSFNPDGVYGNTGVLDINNIHSMEFVYE